jgi:predicted nucleotidyltransferase
MRLGLVRPGFREEIIQLTGAYLSGRSEVSAAYLFGSAAEASDVVNDVDVLVLVRETDLNGILRLVALLEVDLAKHLGVSSDDLDLIPFDLRLIAPWVLYDAIKTGILVKCDDEDLLTDAIERLSQHFLENEGVLRRRGILSEQRFPW